MIFPVLPALIVAQAAGEIRELPLNEIRGLRVWDQSGNGMSRGTRPGHVISYWVVRFKNETPKEIGTITVRLDGYERGRVSFQSAPVTIRSFVNVGVSHRGSLLPGEKSEFDRSGVIGFDLTEEQLRHAGDGMRVEMLSATGFRRSDLHDPGHLYAFLHNMRRPDILARLKQDPSLVKVKNAQGLTTTLMAFDSCDTEVIRYILSHGGNAKDRTARGSTIMHMAAMNGYPGVADLALKLGGDPNARTASGRTPLMKSISRGQPVGWRWLLAHHAKVDLVSPAGESAVGIAINEGQTLALEDMVRSGLSPRTRDSRGMGWLDYGINNGAMLDWLERYHLPIDGRNPKTGTTALMLAARNGRPDTVIWCLAQGANPDLKDKQGKTAYDYARAGGVNLPGLVRAYSKHR